MLFLIPDKEDYTAKGQNEKWYIVNNSDQILYSYPYALIKHTGSLNKIKCLMNESQYKLPIYNDLLNGKFKIYFENENNVMIPYNDDVLQIILEKLKIM